MSFKAGSSAISLLWSTFDQSKSPDEIGFNLIKSNLDSNMAGDCRNLLTLLKRVRGSRRISQQYGKDQNRSTDLPFSSSAEAILASQQGYFPDSNRFGSICFHIFKGDDYTLALPINSPPGAQGEGAVERGSRDRRSIKVGFCSQINPLLIRRIRLLHNAPCVLEFRDLLENCFL